MQRLCCEAILQAVIVNPDGTIDRICAEQRTANRAQRRMLAAMYSTCAHPQCQIPFTACRIHHIVWWTRGGKTVLANLVHSKAAPWDRAPARPRRPREHPCSLRRPKRLGEPPPALCEQHHHLVHEGGWNVEIDEQRHVTWTRPDGTI